MGIFDTKASDQSKFSEENVIPAGNHPAYFFAILDLGTHADDFQGEKREIRKILYAWELPAEGGRIISQDYNLPEQLSPKSNLRKMLESVAGRKFSDGQPINIAAVLGRPCLVTITHVEKGEGDGRRVYSRFGAVGPVPRGMALAPMSGKPFTWEIAPRAVLPSGDWIKDQYVFLNHKRVNVAEVIRTSKEWTALHGQAAPPQANGSAPAAAAASQTAAAPQQQPEYEEIPF